MIEIAERPSQEIAYIRVVGPYAEVIGPGFERLMAWSEANDIQGSWYALYWDNPDITLPEALKTDVAVTISNAAQVSGEVQRQQMPAGLYAVRRCRVQNDDFETPWRAFFADLSESAYQFGHGACAEQYFNNGKVDGFWDIEMIIPVAPK